MHEHTDHYRRQSHGNYYQRGSTAADSCRFGIARRKQCLHIGLRRNNTHNHRTEADKTVLHAASEKTEPGICRKALRQPLPSAHIGVGQKAADENAGENQHNLKNAGHTAAAEAAEKHQQQSNSDNNGCCSKQRYAEQAGNQMQRGKRARHDAEKNTGAGAEGRQPPRRLAVIRNEILRYCGQRATAQGHSVKRRHQQKRDTAAQRKPPSRQPQLEAKLCRADGSSAADNRADNRACDKPCARATASYVIIIGRLHPSGCQKPRQQRHQKRYSQADIMCSSKLHNAPPPIF